MKTIFYITITLILASQLSGCAFIKSSQISLKETNFESTLRVPAAEQQPCSRLLLAFYANQDEKIMKSRIKATNEDPHKFFRSFPPLYYKILEDVSFGNILVI